MAQSRLRTEVPRICPDSSYSPVPKRAKLDHEDNLGPEPSRLGKNVHEMMRLNSSVYADMTLICPDGKRFPAVRMILAMSSSYFQKILSSTFAEKNCSDIYIGVSSKQLGEILEFIYIDDCPSLRTVRSCENTSVVCDTVQDLLDLAFAAEDTCTDRLVSRCGRAIESLYKGHRHIATIVIPVMSQHNFPWCDDLYQSAMSSCHVHYLETLYRKCNSSNVSRSVVQLDDPDAEAVFAELLERKPRQAHSNIFVLLMICASNGTADLLVHSSSCGELSIWHSSEVKILDARLDTARKIARRFNLTYLTPTFLSKVVEVSHLVDKTAINKTDKKLSLQYERDRALRRDIDRVFRLRERLDRERHNLQHGSK